MRTYARTDRLPVAGRQRAGPGTRQRLLDGLRLDGDLRHQVDGRVIGDDDDVLQADAQAFLGDVEARLDGDGPAIGERLGEMADIMDV